MVVTCSVINGVGVVRVGQSLTAVTVDSFREQFSRWQEGEPELKNYIADLEHVDFMDSSGLGTLIVALKRVAERGGDLKIACLQKKPRMVFEITRAYKIFEIYDSVEDALRAF